MEIDLHDQRLAALAQELRPGEGECPFVVRAPHDRAVKLAHFSAGRDASYVVVQAVQPLTVTIGYASFVEGTTLIYDVTEEALQGKARPFECKVQPGPPRVYALLPVQIEAISIALRGKQLNVEFHDARGERIEAALPFQLSLQTMSRQVGAAYSSTDRNGRFVREFATADRDQLLSIAVRSLLTGREERAALLR